MGVTGVSAPRWSGLLAAAALALSACTSPNGAADGTSPSSASARAPSAPTFSAQASSASSPSGQTSSGASDAGGDWPQYHRDAARSGVAPALPEPGSVRVERRVRLDGQVYASPVVATAGGTAVAVVATEANSVYGLRPDGTQLWRTKLGTPVPLSALPCGNIDPLGVTGTPVIDTATSTVYVAAELDAPIRHELVALDLVDGQVKWRRSLDLPGVDRRAMQQRGALALDEGRVWVPFGGLAGDCGDYKGRVVGWSVDGAGSAVAFTVPTTREAGIWTPPGPAVNAAGRMFVSVGNGEAGPGDGYDYSDSVLALDGAERVDSFSPRQWAEENARDADLGSQGPALVGDRWVFIAGKGGTAYVLRQDDLGGIGGSVSSRELCRSFGGTAVVGDTVYVPCTDGVRAVRVGADGRMSVLWHADGDANGSPVVGGNRVWVPDAGGGRLLALDARSGEQRETVDVGQLSRFGTPAVTGDRLLVPTLAGLTIVRVTP
ncbi:MAG: outer membrane protein assembly factor BamB family protein [Actinomycetes bacterium]